MPATAAARTELEALLRTRKLDRTVTRPDAAPAQGVVPTGIAVLDGALGGGLPRGELSEIAGPRSSGRSSVLAASLGAVTTAGELAALVDTLDMFDVESASKAGLRLDRLLWIRGDAISRHPTHSAVEAGFSRLAPRDVEAGFSRLAPRDVEAGFSRLAPRDVEVGFSRLAPRDVEVGFSRLAPRDVEVGFSRPRPRSLGGERLAAADPWARALDRAVKAVNLVLQAGGFDLVVLDLAEVLPEAIRRLPFTTWFRLQRTLEGSRTACVLVTPTPVARSAGGVTVALSRGEASRGPQAAGSTQQAAGSTQHAAGSAQHAAGHGQLPAASRQPPARWSGRPGEVRLLLGVDIEARIVRSREAAEDVCRFAVNT